MRTNITIACLLLVITHAYAGEGEEVTGKKIFTTTCASCHNVNKHLTGPALAGVADRHPLEWIVKFVQSSQTMVKAGDQAAVTLFENNNKIVMPDHPDMDATAVKNVLAYIKSETNVAAEKAPFARPGKLRPNYRVLIFEKDYPFIAAFVGLLGLLIFALLLAVRTKEIEREQLKQKR